MGTHYVILILQLICMLPTICMSFHYLFAVNATGLLNGEALHVPEGFETGCRPCS
jgi:hypothetical protein